METLLTQTCPAPCHCCTATVPCS